MPGVASARRCGAARLKHAAAEDRLSVSRDQEDVGLCAKLPNLHRSGRAEMPRIRVADGRLGRRRGGEGGCARCAQAGQGPHKRASGPMRGLSAGRMEGIALGGAGYGLAGAESHDHVAGLCLWMRGPSIDAIGESAKWPRLPRPLRAAAALLTTKYAPILSPREFDDSAVAPKSFDDRIRRDSIIKTACRPCCPARNGADHLPRGPVRAGVERVLGAAWCGRRESNPHGQKPGRF